MTRSYGSGGAIREIAPGEWDDKWKRLGQILRHGTPPRSRIKRWLWKRNWARGKTYTVAEAKRIVKEEFPADRYYVEGLK